MGVEYRCDKCAIVAVDIEHFATIGIALVPKSTHHSPIRMLRPQLWCDTCLGKIDVRMSKFQVVIEPQTKLEDLIRELIADEIENSKGN